MSLSNNFPAVAPSLLLDFAASERLDPRITFTRSTTATYYDGVTTVKASGSITNSPGTTVASTNGVTVSVFTNSSPASTGADRMFIGSRAGTSLHLNSCIRKIAFYPIQLSQTLQNSITSS